MSLLTAVAPSIEQGAEQKRGYQPAAVQGNQLLGLVRPGLQVVEAKMKRVDSAIFAPLSNAFLDLIGSGGKRLRPALALLAGGINGAAEQTPSPRVIALAAAVEMLHTATLVHDDVIDGALLRRGAPTLNATWNGGSTVLAGNYMFGAAARFSAETQNLRVIRLFSDTLKIIVDGELRQLRDRYNYGQEKSAYYQRIYAKTASLFCAATEGAAILAGCTDAEIKRLRDYGYNFGNIPTRRPSSLIWKNNIPVPRMIPPSGLPPLPNWSRLCKQATPPPKPVRKRSPSWPKPKPPSTPSPILPTKRP